MFDDPTVAGDWTELVHRLDRSGALVRWARAEPALRDVGSIDELAALLAPDAQTDAERADLVLGAVVRTASCQGGDPDAVLLVLHLLADGVRAAAARLADLSPDVLTLLVGELAIRIRTFPPRRSRAYAANLLRDTHRACLRELTPHRTRTYRNGGDLLINPLDHDAVSRWFDRALPGPDDDDRYELADLLAWAHRHAIAPPRDLALLVEFERHRAYGTAARHRVAAAFGINERTLRRRRDRTLTTLRDAAPEYLGAPPASAGGRSLSCDAIPARLGGAYDAGNAVA